YPLGKYTGREFFDLQEGLFTRIRPMHISYVEQIEAKKISEISSTGYDFLDEKLHRDERNKILEAVIKFYQIHVEGFGSLKTLKVLQELSQ
ncbi:MAG: hypothetical protein ACKVJP_09795, partial [Flavobacteriales bacterium]